MKRKMIAPILVGVFVVLYYLLMGIVILSLNIALIIKVALCIIPIIVIGAVIAVVWSRIKEIQGGEENDLSKY